MDEVLFHAERKLEEIQVQVAMASENGMRIVRQASDETKNAAMRFLSDHKMDPLKQSAQEAWATFLKAVAKCKVKLGEISDQAFFIEQLQMIFKDEIARSNAMFICVGLGLGATCGFFLGTWFARGPIPVPCMKAIGCVNYRKRENITLCKVGLPKLLDTTDILVRVRAASIHRLDERISRGYGRTLRGIIQSYHPKYSPEFPLILGRACSGVVEAVGKESKSGLEIGDEVWCVAPFYECGLGAEMIVAPESRIARKPVMIGFEGASSLPYSGCLALNALKEAQLLEENLSGMKILVQDGCSPVGCVLMQLCKKWGAHITATCDVRSVPVVKALGADDVISMKTLKKNSMTESTDSVDQLQLNEKLGKENKTFDYIFVTTNLNFDLSYLEEFLTPNGQMVNIWETEVLSDDYDFFSKYFYSIYVHMKRFLCTLVSANPELGGPHLCHLNLNRLADYVNDGILQTVVDQVYTPNDADKAIRHVCSDKSIGSTIVTFR